jgi:hypothetical protein
MRRGHLHEAGHRCPSGSSCDPCLSKVLNKGLEAVRTERLFSLFGNASARHAAARVEIGFHENQAGYEIRPGRGQSDRDCATHAVPDDFATAQV